MINEADALRVVKSVMDHVSLMTGIEFSYYNLGFTPRENAIAMIHQFVSHGIEIDAVRAIMDAQIKLCRAFNLKGHGIRLDAINYLYIIKTEEIDNYVKANKQKGL